MFPATWDWVSLQAEIAGFLSNSMVSGAVLFTIGLLLAPGAVQALKRAITRR